MLVKRVSSRYEFDRPTSLEFESTWRFIFDSPSLDEILPRLLARILHLTNSAEGSIVSGTEYWDTTQVSAVSHADIAVVSVDVASADEAWFEWRGAKFFDAIEITPAGHGVPGLARLPSSPHLFEVPLWKWGERECALILRPICACAAEQVSASAEHIKFAIFCARSAAHRLQSQMKLDQAEASLDLSRGQISMLEQELSEAQRITKTGTWYWNVRTGEDRWSAEAYKILGADPRKPPTYQSFLDCVHPDDRVSLQEKIDAAASVGAHMPVEYRVVHADGSVHYLKTLGLPHRDANGDLIYFGVMSDITEMKVAEDRMSNLQSDLERVGRIATIGAFVGSIAHELNQPLAAVLASADAARRWMNRNPHDPDEVRACIERIQSDAQRAASVVRHLRNLMVRTNITRVEVDLPDAIRDVLSLLAVELRRQNVVVDSTVVDKLRVVGDPVQLHQVLLNLFANGIDATRDVTTRAKQIRIHCFVSDDGASAVVSVSDTGVGMSEETMKEIFVPFFSTKPGGMGMGLAICRSIIEAHDGTLKVTSAPDIGSTFEIRLPMHGSRHAAL